MGRPERRGRRSYGRHLAGAGGRTRRRRVLLACVAGLTVVGGLLAAGTSNGYEIGQHRLLSGAAWLASGQVGQLTLLDGASAEVAAQVQVGQPGSGLDVVQQGSAAYAVDHGTGSIRRVDGATFETTPPVVPIRDAGQNLRAFAGTDALYALDTGRGVLTTADSRTLAKRAGPLSLAARVSPQAATLDGAGRLWLLDAASGDLVWIDGAHRHVRTGATEPGTGLLTLADGLPVLVDTRHRTADVLDPASGTTRHRTRLDLRPEDRVQVSGSMDNQRLYVVASRGVLSICDLTASSCPNAVPLAAGDSDLGTPIEAGGRVFVPDYANGQVWIVDASGLQVLARPQVLPAGTRFQLLTRDGVVFFNDPNSERAGVIRLDGGIRPVLKYNPKDPTKGLDKPAGNDGLSGSNPPPNQPDKPDQPNQPKEPKRPDQTNGPNPSSGPTQPGRPGDPTGPPTGPTGPPTDPTGPPTDPTGNAPEVTITTSVARPVVDQAVVLSVTANGAPSPVSTHWTFGDGTQGDGAPVTHSWQTAQTFLVSVTATFAGGGQSRKTVSIPVAEKALPLLTVNVNPVNGGIVTGVPGSGGCGSTCSTPVTPGQMVTLSANTTAGNRFVGWAGCPGTTPLPTICQFSMPATAVAITATFAAITHVVTAGTTGTGTGTVSGGGINCPSDCSQSFVEGTSVTLTATAGSLTTFDGWTGPCSGTARTCTFSVQADTNVSAKFTKITSNTVPDVRGMETNAAADAVGAAGFRFSIAGEVEDNVSCNNVGKVASQTPGGGSVLPLGTTVSVKVFVKPAPPKLCG